MKSSSRSVTSIVILGLVLESAVPGARVYGQANPASNFSFPGADPAVMNMQLIAANVQTAMAACAQKSQVSRVSAFADKSGTVGSLAGLAFKESRKDSSKDLLAGLTETKPSGTCYDAVALGKADASGVRKFDTTKISEVTKKQVNCLMSCDPPEEEATGCVVIYGTTNTGKYTADQRKAGNDRIQMALDKIKIYKAFQNFKMNACVNQEELDLKLAQELYQCQQKALSDAVSAAALQLQNALNEHKTAFDKMSQANQELFQQWVDINVALGAKDPDEDPLFNMGGDKTQSNQFGGLLGIQRALNEDLAAQETKGAEFKTKVDELKQSIQANNDNLERGRMESVSGCMSKTNSIGVSGGRALTCFRPMKDKEGQPMLDANGNPKYAQGTCGPIEFLKTQVEQSAFKTSRGNVVMSQNRRDDSNRLGIEFQNIADSILQDMAPPASEGEVLSPDATTWSEISSKYGPALNELSQKTGVNLMGQLEKVASFCFTTGDRWKNQQIRSASSTYGKAKAENEKKRSELNGELQKGLGDLKKNYSDAMAVLGNQAVALNTYNCTKSDPQKMLDCYDQIRTNTRDLLEGTGASATVIRNAKGQPIAPPCKGINGCVTVLNQARKVKKGHVQEGRRIQTSFAIQAKAKIDQNVLGLANLLKGLQGQVSAQFGVVAGLANRLGVKAGASPKMVEGAEALAPVEANPGPPPSGPGPYKSPGDMAKVLSGKMMPGGMINFSDDGMGDVVADAMEKIKEKKEKEKERLEKFKDNSKEIDDLAKTCGKDDKDNVGNGACDQCSKSMLQACSGGGSGGGSDPVSEILNAVQGTATDMNSGDFQKAYNALGGLTCPDPDVLSVCNNCVGTKQKAYETYKTEVEKAKVAKP